MSERYAFQMRLRPGKRAEYQSRHDEIWPDLVELLRDAGISDYSIWLDEETNSLFAILTRRDNHTMDALSEHPVMRRWWKAMADLMETYPDDAPVARPLVRVFNMD